MAKGRDRLTGLLDRNGGYAATGQRVTQAHLNGRPLSVLWIDIDRFQAINHSFGHPGGDRLVMTLAERIEFLVKGSGDLARMSGDEFLLLLPAFDVDAAKDFARQIDRFLAQTVEIEGVQIHPSVSIGIAALEREEDAVRLLLRADRAKTVAKKQGGGCFSVSGEKLALSGYRLVREELEIEAKLHVAIETGGLDMYYQPIVRPDGTVEAVEALMRCQVDGQFIPPAKLIPVAEKTGLIGRLGEWTISEGAQFARRLADAGYQIKVAVNVSRAQLASPGFVPSLHSALMLANTRPHLLELELTESMFLDTSPVVRDNLRGAREAGVGLAIDDFGTGYSSLAALKDIPATKLKLDRSFIVVLPEERKALAVVRAMASLGRELGLNVVAEGVETEEQRLCLEQLGVDGLQGFLYSPPMPREQLFGWIEGFEAVRKNPLAS